MEHSSFWFKLLVAKYGEEVGWVKDGGRTGSRWWRDI